MEIIVLFKYYISIYSFLTLFSFKKNQISHIFIENKVYLCSTLEKKNPKTIL